MKTGKGIPKNDVVNILNTSGAAASPKPIFRELLLEINSAKPLAPVIMANVTIKACIFPQDVRAPLIKPAKAPASKATIIVNEKPSCQSIMPKAVNVAASANTEPTERSIPDVIITRVIPIDIIPISET